MKLGSIISTMIGTWWIMGALLLLLIAPMLKGLVWFLEIIFGVINSIGP